MGTFEQFAAQYARSSSNDASAADVLAGLLVFFGAMVFVAIIAIPFIIGMWKTFVKAGRPGWAALIPIYNKVVELEIAGKPVWWIIVYLLDFTGIFILVVSILVGIGMGRKFNRSDAFGAIVMGLFPGIGYLILGFGPSKFQHSHTAHEQITAS